MAIRRNLSQPLAASAFDGPDKPTRKKVSKTIKKVGKLAKSAQTKKKKMTSGSSKEELPKRFKIFGSPLEGFEDFHTGLKIDKIKRENPGTVRKKKKK
jgi:hypothetical protein